MGIEPGVRKMADCGVAKGLGTFKPSAFNGFSMFLNPLISCLNSWLNFRRLLISFLNFSMSSAVPGLAFSSLNFSSC